MNVEGFADTYFLCRGFGVVNLISTGITRLKRKILLLNLPNTYTTPVIGQSFKLLLNSPIAAMSAFGR